MATSLMTTGVDIGGKHTTALAWVNFNGTSFGERDSYNVSSLTDNGTGDYMVNHGTISTTTAAVFSIGSESTANDDRIAQGYKSSATAFRITCNAPSNGTRIDLPYVVMVAFGD